MIRTLRNLAVVLALLPGVAAAQMPTIPDHSVIGRIGIGGSSGPAQSIPFNQVLSNLAGTPTGNTVWASPASGGAGQPAFRALVTADFPTNGVTLANLPQGIANSIWINPTGSTANMQNVAVPACANDHAHGLVYVNGTGLQCATLTTGGTVTTAGTGLSLTGGGTTLNLALTSATLQAVPASPTGTTSTTGVMMGLGTTVAITPVYSSRVMVTFFGSMSNSGANTGTIFAKFGTGTAPANGVATTGTSIGNQIAGIATVAGQALPFSTGGVVAGLTPGTAYWFDLSVTASAGTESLSRLSVTATEF